MQCLEYSVGCRVYIVKCRVSTAECECKVLCLESLECRVRSARSAVLNVDSYLNRSSVPDLIEG